MKNTCFMYLSAWTLLNLKHEKCGKSDANASLFPHFSCFRFKKGIFSTFVVENHFFDLKFVKIKENGRKYTGEAGFKWEKRLVRKTLSQSNVSLRTELRTSRKNKKVNEPWSLITFYFYFYFFTHPHPAKTQQNSWVARRPDTIQKGSRSVESTKI